MNADAQAGVYLPDGAGGWRCIHHYRDGDYGLEHVVECFALGTRAPDPAPGEVALRLSAGEAAQLKVMADAQSFDYDPEFIEMCLAIARHVPAGASSVTLTANF